MSETPTRYDAPAATSAANIQMIRGEVEALADTLITLTEWLGDELLHIAEMLITVRDCLGDMLPPPAPAAKPKAPKKPSKEQILRATMREAGVPRSAKHIAACRGHSAAWMRSYKHRITNEWASLGADAEGAVSPAIGRIR